MKDFIHINCDLGEGGQYDEQLMPLISACNIACGGHAGNLDSMHRTVRLAMEHKVEIGAHPSYPDRENFGRTTLKMSEKDLSLSVEGQVLSLKQVAESEGGKLTHIKPHGALYNDAAGDENVARALLKGLEDFDDDFILYVPINSKLADLAMGKFEVYFEAFADRNYNEDYSLVSRQNSHALIAEKEAVFEQVFRVFNEGKIHCHNGQKIDAEANTFCLHSDTPSSLEILKFLHKKFAEKGIGIKTT